MSEKLFHDAEFAQFYDWDNPWSPDRDYCRKLAEDAASVLDLGCGTGAFAASLAPGRRVTGVEPAAAMLDIARNRAGGEKVRWVEADARTVRLDERFDLIVMIGHAFQCLLTDDDQRALCRTIAAHLAPGGRFIFDSRNPACQEWKGWVPDKTHRVFSHPVMGRVEAWHDVRYDYAREVASYDTVYRALASGQEWKATSEIRFATRETINRNIEAAGLRVEKWLGDWHGGPWSEGAKEIIPMGRQ